MKLKRLIWGVYALTNWRVQKRVPRLTRWALKNATNDVRELVKKNQELGNAK